MKPFKEPIYVTKPVVPSLNKLTDKLKEIVASGWFTNIGEQHRQLEDNLRKYLKVPFLSLFNNGTTALMVACKALELKGEVITTPFTFPATPNVLLWNGIKPVFCDIDSEYLNLDPEKIESAITPETSGILAVHVYGNPCDLNRIQEIADKYNLKVIYDAAHAFGVENEKGGIGNYGDISMFSFHATKLLHTAEGGCLTYKDPELEEKIYLLRNFGIRDEEKVLLPGINGKMNEIQAAVGLIVLEVIGKEIQNRHKLAEKYRDNLKNISGVSIVPQNPSVNNCYQYFVIRINRENFGHSRDYVYEKLKEYNIFTRKYFYPLCSNYGFYKDLPSAHPDNLPVANQAAMEVLALPIYGSLNVDDVERICSAVRELKG